MAIIALTAIACSHENADDDQVFDQNRIEWGVDLNAIDKGISPGNNFYRYVNQGWIDRTELPDGYALYSAPWEVQSEVLGRVEKLITEGGQNLEHDARFKRVQSLFSSFMDADEIERRGIGPIKAELTDILSIETHEQVAIWLADPRIKSIFHLRVKPPPSMQGGYVLSIEQYRVTGLGLPSQDHYKSDEDRFSRLRDTYGSYIAATFERAGIDSAKVRADRVLDLETALANIMWSFAQIRDAGAAFDPIPVSELETRAPGFPWPIYLETRGLENVEVINFGVGAITESAALFSEISVEDWKSYLAFHWIDQNAPLLDQTFSDAHFEFHEQQLFGIEGQTSRLDRAVEFVQYYLSDDVGALYFDRYFDDDTERQLHEMTSNIRIAFHERLLAADWMDDPTRDEALRKLDEIIFEIGKPEIDMDWSALQLDPKDLIGNYNKIKGHSWHASRDRIGQPISRLGDWNMGPHRIGLGYHQQYNKIFITAGALLPPFFDPEADAGVNYGAIGQSIAHEFGHALDDQGSKFDSEGALRNWWSDATRREYDSRANKLIQQFAEYEVLPGVPLSSEQMIGEIIGDLVGMSIGYRAYELHLDDVHRGESPLIDGFSARQRFFLGAAQQTRTIATQEALMSEARNASHPPAEFRINGIVRNMDEWYRDFDVTEDDDLYLAPDRRVRLW